MTTEPPELWWSPTEGPIVQETREGSAFYGEYRPANTVRWMEELPDDAVALAPARSSPTDDRHTSSMWTTPNSSTGQRPNGRTPGQRWSGARRPRDSSVPTAAAPWTATLAYTPDQNGGAVSMFDGRVSLPAVMGLLAAGEPPEIVAAEYNCTVEAARVVAQLLEDFRDGLFDDSNEDPKHRGQAFRRGFSDGFNARRAGVPNPTEELDRA